MARCLSRWAMSPIDFSNVLAASIFGISTTGFFGAPETATYTVALWHPLDEIGRYTFVIGQREVLGGEADCYSSYSDYWTPLVAGENPYRDTIFVGESALAMEGYPAQPPACWRWLRKARQVWSCS